MNQKLLLIQLESNNLNNKYLNNDIHMSDTDFYYKNNILNTLDENTVMKNDNEEEENENNKNNKN